MQVVWPSIRKSSLNILTSNWKKYFMSIVWLTEYCYYNCQTFMFISWKWMCDRCQILGQIIKCFMSSMEWGHLVFKLIYYNNIICENANNDICLDCFKNHPFISPAEFVYLEKINICSQWLETLCEELEALPEIERNKIKNRIMIRFLFMSMNMHISNR